MRPVPKIETPNMTRFTLALYVSFHQAIWACINMIASLEKVLIPEELKTQYQTLVEKLTDKNNEQRARYSTEEQANDDAERDRLISYLFFVIQNGLRSTKEAVRAAAKLLAIVIGAYEDIQKLGYTAETGSIRGLIADLEKEENIEAVQTLKLQPIIDELQTANETFDTKWKDMVDATAAKSREASTTALREQTDDVFNELCERIYASGFVATEPDDISLITNIINELNGIIANFKTSHNLSAAKKKSKKKPEAGTEKPSETTE